MFMFIFIAYTIYNMEGSVSDSMLVEEEDECEEAQNGIPVCGNLSTPFAVRIFIKNYPVTQKCVISNWHVYYLHLTTN